MRTRFFFSLALSLCWANRSLGLGAETPPRPEPFVQAAQENGATASAVEHLRLAAEQLEVAGLAQEAARVRDEMNRLKGRVGQPGPSTQLSVPQTEAPKAQQVARPNQVVLRCEFVELQAAEAEKFEAAAEPATPPDPWKRQSPGLAVYKNADKVMLKLAKSGKAKIIGSPELCTNVDFPASVTSGGEFPILVPQANNQVTIHWHWFGVRCMAVPHWLDTGKIQLEVNPEMAVKDFKSSVKSGGLTIPGLTTRRANVRVEMNLGETAVVNFGIDSEKVELGGSNAENEAVSLLPPVLQSVIRLANAEIDVPPAKPPITLFLVTPVAADPSAK